MGIFYDLHLSSWYIGFYIEWKVCLDFSIITGFNKSGVKPGHILKYNNDSYRRFN